MTNRQHFETLKVLAAALEASMTEAQRAEWLAISEEDRKESLMRAYWTAVAA